MRGAPTTQSPAMEARRALGRWLPITFYDANDANDANDASMDASFAVEVQSNVRVGFMRT
jgi:hypothetical protein